MNRIVVIEETKLSSTCGARGVTIAVRTPPEGMVRPYLMRLYLFGTEIPERCRHCYAEIWIFQVFGFCVTCQDHGTWYKVWR